MANVASFPKHGVAAKGVVYRVAGELIDLKATATETGGPYALCETRNVPAGGLPPHRYRYDDTAVIVLGPGAYAFVPRETVRALTNLGPTPGRLLVIVSPGDVYERFVAAVGRPAGREDIPLPWDAAELANLAAVGPIYGFEFDLLLESDTAPATM